MDGTSRTWLGRVSPRRVLISACLLLAATSLQAQEGSTKISGYGSWYYGNTDGNSYTVGDDQGSYEHGQMALAFGAEVTDKLRVYAQTDFVASHEDLEVELDYALAEWVHSDAFKARLGRVKMPFGLYTEIYDVGTLRPFDVLPQGLYGGGGFVSEGVTGVALAGRRAGRWSLAYDAYFGEVDTIDDGLRLDPTGTEAEAETGALRDSIGGRLVLSTPVRGLSFGASAYTGKTTEDDATRRNTLGLQAEYADARWTLRSEYARQTFSEDGRGATETWYAEAARRLGGWQVGARYDWFRDEAGDLLENPALGEHEDLGFALNYWFAEQFVVKAAYHRVTGNRFARPEDWDGQSEPEPRTNLLTLNVDFAF